MGAWREYETLTRRAAAFWRHALEALDRGEYDLACFLAEQAVQLKIKALLVRVAGYTPRGHGLRELLGCSRGPWRVLA